MVIKIFKLKKKLSIVDNFFLFIIKPNSSQPLVRTRRQASTE